MPGSGTAYGCEKGISFDKCMIAIHIARGRYLEVLVGVLNHVMALLGI